jgi:hypothetical protein
MMYLQLLEERKALAPFKFYKYFMHLSLTIGMPMIPSILRGMHILGPEKVLHASAWLLMQRSCGFNRGL